MTIGAAGSAGRRKFSLLSMNTGTVSPGRTWSASQVDATPARGLPRLS
jgi:hypothetical protein